jgi:RimJ/RimL family protein N-acetyltransferase
MAVMYPELETDRLRLRQFRQSDIDAFADFVSNEETMRYIGGACDREEAWKRLAINVGHWPLRGFGPWAVEEKATGAFIGRAGVWYPETWPGPEIVWALVPEKRGQGFATEAASASIQYAFDTLRLDRVPSIIHPDNGPSLRVARRLGQRHAGELVRNGTLRRVYTIDRA